MKKLLNLAFLLLTVSTYAQQYNTWEVNANLGFYKTTVGTADNYHNFVGTPFAVDLGVTYFTSPSFGGNISVGYFNLKSNRFNRHFRTDYLRASLSGVIDFRKPLDLNSWYNLRFSFGLGYTEFYPQVSNRLKSREQAGHIIGVLTNQIRITSKLNLDLSLELISHYNMNITFDGTAGTGDPLDAEIGRNTGISDGTIYNFKVGVTYSLKKKSWVKPKIEVNNHIVYRDTTINNHFYYRVEKDPYTEFIYFAFDRDNLDFNDSRVDNEQVNILRRIADKMLSNDDNLQIIASADYRGSVGYNWRLATRRAESVMDYLVRSGVDPNRFEIVVEGEKSKKDKIITQGDRVVRFKVVKNKF